MTDIERQKPFDRARETLLTLSALGQIPDPEIFRVDDVLYRFAEARLTLPLSDVLRRQGDTNWTAANSEINPAITRDSLSATDRAERYIHALEIPNLGLLVTENKLPPALVNHLRSFVSSKDHARFQSLQGSVSQLTDLAVIYNLAPDVPSEITNVLMPPSVSLDRDQDLNLATHEVKNLAQIMCRLVEMNELEGKDAYKTLLVASVQHDIASGREKAEEITRSEISIASHRRDFAMGSTLGILAAFGSSFMSDELRMNPQLTTLLVASTFILIGANYSAMRTFRKHGIPYFPTPSMPKLLKSKAD